MFKKAVVNLDSCCSLCASILVHYLKFYTVCIQALQSKCETF